MTKKQLQEIKTKIVRILCLYMSEDEALERANNIAQIFVWGNDNFTIDDISGFITPTEVKPGISDVSLRNKIATQICLLGL